MRNYKRFGGLAGVLAAACLSCGGTPTTQIVVEVHTNFVVPDELNGLRLKVLTGEQAVFEREYTVGLGEAPVRLPARTSIIPAGEGNATFTVQVDGTLNGTIVVTRRATLMFERERSRLLRIDLLKECRNRSCAPGETCVAGGACASEQVDSRTLPPFDPKQSPMPILPGPDGGITGPSDAGVVADGSADRPTDAPATDGRPSDTSAPSDMAGGDAPVLPDGPSIDADLPDAPPPPPDLPPSTDAQNKPNGASCGAASECSSGVCADGVCCATACDDKCLSCKVNGRVGLCWPVPAGADPDNDCADEGASSCGLDGTCDGAGACRKYAVGTVCKAASCSGSSRTLSSTCDSTGACASGATQSCAPYTCGSTGDCNTSCTPTGDECLPPGVCTNGSCGKKPNGQACGAGSECQSTFCEQGVCCATACSGTCRSCALPGSTGSCTSAPAGTDPLNQCDADSVGSCGRDGQCNGSGACRLYANGTECAGASCTGGQATSARTCDGTGTCKPAVQTACSPYVCGAGGCRSNCTTGADCVPGYQCGNGVCVPAVPENCTNGVDDDADGNVDCADSDCGTFMCVPPPPANWVGPVAFAEGKALSPPPACSGAYPGEVFSGGGGSITCPDATCSQCVCGAPAGAACSNPVIYVYSPNFKGCLDGINKQELDPKGGCISPTSNFEISESSLLRPGTCAASGGTPAKPQAAFEAVARACRGSGVGGGGCPGAVCAPKPGTGFHSKLCVYASGDLACPAGYNGARQVYYSGVDDTRGCEPCRCGGASGETCQGRLNVWPEPRCPLLKPRAAYTPLACSTPATLPSFEYVGSFPSGGSCAPTPVDPKPLGGCAPTGPTTICCQP